MLRAIAVLSTTAGLSLLAACGGSGTETNSVSLGNGVDVEFESDSDASPRDQFRSAFEAIVDQSGIDQTTKRCLLRELDARVSDNELEHILQAPEESRTRQALQVQAELRAACVHGVKSLQNHISASEVAVYRATLAKQLTAAVEAAPGRRDFPRCVIARIDDAPASQIKRIMTASKTEASAAIVALKTPCRK